MNLWEESESQPSLGNQSQLNNPVLFQLSYAQVGLPYHPVHKTESKTLHREMKTIIFT